MADLLSNARGELEQVAREHLAIVDTTERRDPEPVVALMREHISRTRGRWAHPVAPSAEGPASSEAASRAPAGADG